MDSALISRLEQAEAGSRELDAAVYRLLAGKSTDHWFKFGDQYFSDDTVYSVTTSIDAAMSLVPEGWNWSIDCIDGKYSAVLNNTPIARNAQFSQYLPNPALALCIASLKAAGYE